MASGPPPGPPYQPQYQHPPYQYQSYPPSHPYPPRSQSGLHAYPQPPTYYAQHEQAYVSPVSYPAHTPQATENDHEHPDRKRLREGSPSPYESVPTSWIADPLYLRQQILENGKALMAALCPTTYGPHNQVQQSLILLKAPHGDRWQAGMACDGVLTIEGPEGRSQPHALNLLLDAISSRLASCIPKAWGDEKSGQEEDDDTLGVEKDVASGAKFATESRTST